MYEWTSNDSRNIHEKTYTVRHSTNDSVEKCKAASHFGFASNAYTGTDTNVCLRCFGFGKKASGCRDS